MCSGNRWPVARSTPAKALEGPLHCRCPHHVTFLAVACPCAARTSGRTTAANRGSMAASHRPSATNACRRFQQQLTGCVMRDQTAICMTNRKLVTTTFPHWIVTPMKPLVARLVDFHQGSYGSTTPSPHMDGDDLPTALKRASNFARANAARVARWRRWQNDAPAAPGRHRTTPSPRAKPALPG